MSKLLAHFFFSAGTATSGNTQIPLSTALVTTDIPRITAVVVA